MYASRKGFALLHAHSANSQGQRQPLVEHLRNVADLARQFATPFGGGDLGYLAGLWHDAGKADPRWQQRLGECERERGAGAHRS